MKAAGAGSRVLILLENNPFPADFRIRNEAVALAAAGYRVTIACPRAPGQRLRDMAHGVRVYRYPAPPKATNVYGYLLEYAYSMAALFMLSLVVLVREGIDVVHAANPPDTLVLIAAFYKLLGKPFIFDHHDLAPEMFDVRFGSTRSALLRTTLLTLERVSCRIADHILATNESYKRIAMERGGVPRERITVVRNGPELKEFSDVEPPCGLREPGKRTVGYGGMISAHDGVDHLVRAIAHLVHDLRRPDVLCVIVGAGEALASVKELAAELDLADHVRFTGWLPIPEYVRHLSACDICVEPVPKNAYTDRSTMIKMMEYMALAKPIVAFDLAEHRVSAGDAALYVQPNDDSALARAIAELMDDTNRRQQMGAVGRRRIDVGLSWSHSIPHLLDAYRGVVSSPRRAADEAGLRLHASLPGSAGGGKDTPHV